MEYDTSKLEEMVLTEAGMSAAKGLAKAHFGQP
jgi:hypothetical protein